MADSISVPFAVMADSGLQEGWDAETGGWATVKFKCAWDDRIQLVKDLTGTASYTLPSGGGGPQLIAQFPYRYPGSPNLWCRAIESIVPFGRPKMLAWPPLNKWLAREEAIVTARFGYFPFTGPDPIDNQGQTDASGKPYTSTSVQLSAEIATIPDFSLRFPDDVPNSTPFPIIVPQAQITFKRYMIPYLPIAEMLSILGCVNGGPMRLGNFFCPTGTVLFCGGNSEITLNMDGIVLQTVDYQFQFRRYPWNQAIHPVTAQWEYVTDQSGQNPYPTGNFSILP